MHDEWLQKYEEKAVKLPNKDSEVLQNTKHGLISFVWTAITSNYGIYRINI